MQAIGTLVEFPGLEISTGPSRFRQPLKGFASWIFNDLLINSKINVTVIPTLGVGTGCSLVNGSTVCNGLYEQLQTCEADFSILAITLSAYDHRMPQLPVLHGPLVESHPMALLSYNTSAESKTPFIGVTKIDKLTYCFLFVVLFSLILLNSLNLHVMMRKKRRITWRPKGMQLILKEPCLLFKIIEHLNLTRTRVSFFLAFLLFMLCTTLMIGLAQTNKLLKHPPKYFEDIVGPAQNESYKVIVLKNVYTLSNLKKYEDPAVRKMARGEPKGRVVKFDPLDLMGISRTIIQSPSSHFLLANKVVCRVVKAYICNQWISMKMDRSPQGNFIPPWYTKIVVYMETQTAATYSRCIKKDVRKRLDVMYNRLTQSQLYERYLSGSPFRIPLNYKKKNFLCIENAPPFSSESQKVERTTEHHQWIFFVVLFLLFVSFLVALVIYLLEKLAHLVEEKNARRKRMFRIIGRCKGRMKYQVLILPRQKCPVGPVN